MRRAGALVVLGLATTSLAQERADLEVVHRIKQEATRGSQVMDHLFALTDQNGPRLTGSPGFKRAADWAVGRLQAFGVGSARVESWGRFGRGWTLTRYEAHLLEPAYAALPGIPLAWSGGTNGTVTAEVTAAPLWTAQEGPRRLRHREGRSAGQGVCRRPEGPLGRPHRPSRSRARADASGGGGEPALRRQGAGGGSPRAGALRRPAPGLAAQDAAGRPPEAGRAVRERSHRGQRGLLPAPRGGRAAALRLPARGRRRRPCFATIGGARGAWPSPRARRPGRRARGCLPPWSSWSPRPTAAWPASRSARSAPGWSSRWR